ncbi:Scr1 family TA system antitoxin-like transcriptional regulator [Actinomadura rugatobispora]|uniref:Scr1 family TA system antitoxin-like transcriptional regulator n=1 Tax=Actinomadura rugatobispora TaxID=1994 RepID=A0ABW1A9C1_9ACTN|nr:helix-turn-helix transcriptional regulator [Actinomadura rugatobispora]
MSSSAESIDPMAGLWSLLAFHLRILRKQHRLSQAAVGRLVGADHKTVSNWEAGRNHPPVEALRTLDDEWRTGGLLAALHHYASTLQAPAQFRAFAEYESIATVIRMNGVAFIPGLLQTPEYAEAVFRLAGEPDVEGQVAQRLERQTVITRQNAPYVSVLLSEVALLLAPSRIRLGQLEKLAAVANLPNVTLRVVAVDVGPQVGLGGAFHIFSTSEREVGFVETPARGRLVTESGDLRRLTVAFDRTGGRALSPEATRERLQEMIEAQQ